MTKLQRAKENPILVPNLLLSWEQEGAFNGCVSYQNGAYHIVYRALSARQIHQGIDMQVSSIGYAQGTDGLHFGDHLQFIKPEQDWEIYGCEDPRITYLDGKYYVFYTALSVYPFAAYGIKTAVAITKDLKTIEAKHPVTTFNSKAIALFPEKINGKYAAILTAHTDMPPSKICIALFDKEEDIWSPVYWQRWYSDINPHIVHLLRDFRDQIEVGAPPVKTEHGWLLIYSYIKNYFTDSKIFGIEAVLLDLNDPHKIVGRTSEPLLVPETDYENIGNVSHIAFPSGTVVKDGILSVYYGAADTRCAVATCKLDDLLHDMLPQKTTVSLPTSDTKFTRFEGNPIITPAPEIEWESKAIFNPAVVYENGKIHLVYRAQSQDGTSVFGYASTRDGFHIDEQLADPIYVPREDFEKKTHPTGNSGCEDARITRLGDRYYMLYVSYDGTNPPRVTLTSISVSDFLNKNWNWDKPKIISFPGADDKDAAIFPKKINEKYVFLHRLKDSIWLDFVDDITFSTNSYLDGRAIVSPRKDKWDNVKLGIAGPPIEIQEGWLLIYHAVSEPGFKYKLGAVLLDINDPTKILGRTDEPIFEPEKDYEIAGEVPNVVFPCGAAILNNIVYIYYGGADKVIGVATIPLDKLLKTLTPQK